jgi:hypothetical protein
MANYLTEWCFRDITSEEYADAEKIPIPNYAYEQIVNSLKPVDQNYSTEPICICRNLYLDVSHLARDEGMLKQYGITHIINCGEEEVLKYDTINVVNVSINDEQPITRYMFDIIKMICNRKGTLLVTSPTKTDRSAVMFGVYMVYVLGLELSETIKILHHSNHVLFSNTDYIRILIGFRKREYDKEVNIRPVLPIY